MLTLIQTMLCFTAGTVCVFAGLTFINGQLLPEVLHSVYAWLSNPWLRTFVASITLFMAANYFNAKGYVIGGQALGGPIYVVCFILGMVITAMLIQKIGVNGHIIAGTAVLCLGALWIVYGLKGV